MPQNYPGRTCPSHGGVDHPVARVRTAPTVGTSVAVVNEPHGQDSPRRDPSMLRIRRHGEHC